MVSSKGKRVHPHLLNLGLAYFVCNLQFYWIGKVEFLRRLQFKRNTETKCQNVNTKGSDYLGHQNVTQSGLTCQQWQNASFGNYLKHQHLPGNYCRCPPGQTGSGTLMVRPASGATLESTSFHGSSAKFRSVQQSEHSLGPKVCFSSSGSCEI